MWGQIREGGSFSKRTWAKNQKTWTLVQGPFILIWGLLVSGVTQPLWVTVNASINQD